MRCAALAATATVLALVTGCAEHDQPSSDSAAGIPIQAQESVPLQIGNLVQRILKPGSTATALCYVSEDRVPTGFPGSAIRVRSGQTVGYTVVEVDGHGVFDVSGQELRKGLPDCPEVGLQ